jgi:hypothetical protein
MLQSIASQGIVPLFAHWTGLQTKPLGPDPGEWADTSYLVDYIKTTNNLTEIDRIQYEAAESKESYTWPWTTLLELRRNLDSLSGLVEISLDGCDGDVLLAEFTQNRVTVATIWGTPEIRCQEFDRQEWTDHLLELIIGREPASYGQVFNLTKEEVDEMKGPVWFSVVTIMALK